MSLYRHRGGWVIAASFVVALMLTALKLPEWALIWRPAWVALVLIYWCMAVPTGSALPSPFCWAYFSMS